MYSTKAAIVRAPLSFQQLALWHSAEQRSTGLFALRMRGIFRPELMQRSVAELTARHEALRTSIVSTAGAALEQAVDSSAYVLELKSLDEVPASERERSARRFAHQFFNQRIYAAAEDGPFHARLLMLSDRDHVLLLTVRHIVADALSVTFLFRELWQRYADLSHGRPSPAIAAPARYADYAIRQRREDRAWVALHAAFWKERLAGTTEVHLPLDESPAGRGRGGLASVRLAFDAQVSGAVRELARRARAFSPAMVLLAVYVAVLSRWCDCRDLIVPFVMSGRHLATYVETIGFFSYSLFLRVTLTGKEEFIELLRKVCGAFFAALQHEDFGRVSARAPKLLTGASFNWVGGDPDELAGLPPVALRAQLAPQIAVESFIPVEFRAASYQSEDDVGISTALLLYGAERTLSAILYYRARLARVCEFAAEIQWATQQFVRTPFSGTSTTLDRYGGRR